MMKAILKTLLGLLAITVIPLIVVGIYGGVSYVNDREERDQYVTHKELNQQKIAEIQSLAELRRSP